MHLVSQSPILEPRDATGILNSKAMGDPKASRAHAHTRLNRYPRTRCVGDIYPVLTQTRHRALSRKRSTIQQYESDAGGAVHAGVQGGAGWVQGCYGVAIP